jgi:hypothetical protein
MSFDEGRALIIGVGTYADSDWNAEITRGDAEDIADALRDDQVAGYPSDHVAVLSGTDATRAKMIAAFKALADASAPDETVLVFYAGHGLLDTNGEYNLTAHDTAFDGDHVAPGTGLSESELLERLRAVRAQKLLLILNACFSGNIGATLGPGQAGQDMPRGAPVSDNLSARVLGTGEGRAVLTACKATQESWYVPGAARTLFGAAVGQALRGQGRIPNAEFIGLWDFYDYVFEKTRDAAALIPGGPLQQPVMNVSQLVGAFPIAIAGERKGAGLGPPAPIAAGPPPGSAANILDPKVIEAAGGYAPGASLEGTTFRAGVQLIDNSKVVDFSGAVIGGSLNVSNVARGNIIQISIGATPASASTADSSETLRAGIEQVRADVDRLVGVDDEKDDITRDLKDASLAAAEGKNQRLLAKLDRAREELLALGPAIPASVPLSETVSVLLQRARSVGT